jgi:hypothetical protein
LGPGETGRREMGIRARGSRGCRGLIQTAHQAKGRSRGDSPAYAAAGRFGPHECFHAPITRFRLPAHRYRAVLRPWAVAHQRCPDRPEGVLLPRPMPVGDDDVCPRAVLSSDLARTHSTPSCCGNGPRVSDAGASPGLDRAASRWPPRWAPGRRPRPSGMTSRWATPTRGPRARPEWGSRSSLNALVCG